MKKSMALPSRKKTIVISCVTLHVGFFHFFNSVKQGVSQDYPAYFVKKADDSTMFIGYLSQVQDLLDANSIKESILKEHPKIVTPTSYFKESLDVFVANSFLIHSS